MHEKAARLILFTLLIAVTGFVEAQPTTGLVTHWEDGKAMDCPFTFEQEPLLEWDQHDPPPVTIQTAAAIARVWGAEKDLTDVSVSSFRLIGVRPWGHDHPMLVMFIKYLGFPPNTRIVNQNEAKWLAITPTGTVVEPDCDGTP